MYDLSETIRRESILNIIYSNTLFILLLIAAVILRELPFFFVKWSNSVNFMDLQDLIHLSIFERRVFIVVEYPLQELYTLCLYIFIEFCKLTQV